MEFSGGYLTVSKSDRNLKCYFCGGRETGKPCHENQQQTQPKPNPGHSSALLSLLPERV